MTLKQNSGWAASGNAIGSHIISHRRLTALSPGEAWEEISESKLRRGQMFAVEISQFAYPYGDYAEQHVEMVDKAGSREAYTKAKDGSRIAFTNGRSVYRNCGGRSEKRRCA